MCPPWCRVWVGIRQDILSHSTRTEYILLTRVSMVRSALMGPKTFHLEALERKVWVNGAEQPVVGLAGSARSAQT